MGIINFTKKQMKLFAYTALVAAASAKTDAELKMDVIQLEEIVTGFLKGAINAEHFDDIATCVKDLDVVLGDAEHAVTDFKKGGATNVIAGLKAMGDLLKYVKLGMTDCSKTKSDWARLEAMAEVISSPKAFIYHVGKDLWINGQPIFTEIETAIADYDNQKWEDFGKQVGMAAAKTILGAENGTCRDNKAKDSCDAAGCSWCTSFAVANACNAIEDAKMLPHAVFICDNLPPLTAEELFLY